MSTRIGEVAGVSVATFASPGGPRVQLAVVSDCVSLTHDDVRELRRVLSKAAAHLAKLQREADR